MREILFRGKSNYSYKNVKAGDWLYSMTISRHCYNDEEISSYYIGCGNNTIDGKTLGQYTGLTDKNGKKIFEGDIVEFESHGYIPSIKKGSVIFKDGCFGIEFDTGYKSIDFRFHRIGEIDEWRDMGVSGTITYTYEIIGNIHDNPELLESGAE